VRPALRPATRASAPLALLPRPRRRRTRRNKLLAKVVVRFCAMPYDGFKSQSLVMDTPSMGGVKVCQKDSL
jgi:hypothetical protein